MYPIGLIGRSGTPVAGSGLYSCSTVGHQVRYTVLLVCYALLWYAMLRCVVLCYVTLFYVTLSCVIFNNMSMQTKVTALSNVKWHAKKCSDFSMYLASQTALLVSWQCVCVWGGDQWHCNDLRLFKYGMLNYLAEPTATSSSTTKVALHTVYMCLVHQACLKSCYQAHLYKKCGCGDPYYPLGGKAIGGYNIRPCDPNNSTQGNSRL